MNLYDFTVRLMADGLVIIIALIGTYMLIYKIPKDHRMEAYKRILLAGLTSYMLAKFASIIYQPTGMRPFELLGLHAGASYLNNAGFPSDHAVLATAITAAVWFETRNKRVSILLACLLILMGLGRVLALVHTPVDIVFGILCGLVGALWYLDGSRITNG